MALNYGGEHTGSNSVVIGRQAKAKATGVIAVGYQANATSDYTTVLGYQAEASSNNSIAIGYNSKAKNNEFVTVVGSNSRGYNTQASVFGSSSGAYAQATAIGNDVYAYGQSSVALGSDDLLGNDYSNASMKSKFGDQLESGVIDTIYNSLRNDRNFFDSEGVFDNKYKGDKAIYSPTYAGGRGAIAIGSRTVAAKDLSTSLGSLSFALAERSTAVGIRSFVESSAIGGTAIGERSSVFASNSVAIGNRTESTNTGTVSYGYLAKAVAQNSIAIGNRVAAGAKFNATITAADNPNDSTTFNLQKQYETVNAAGVDNISSALNEFNTKLNKMLETDLPLVKENNTYLTFGNGSKVQKTSTYMTDNNTASKNAIAIGNSSFAVKENSLAMGFGTLSDADNSFALGSYSYVKAGANNSIAIGVATIVSGANSFVAGVMAGTTAQNTTVLGTSARGTIQNSVALGYRSQTLYFYDNTLNDSQQRIATTTGTSALGLTAYAPVGSTYKPVSSDSAGVVSVGGWVDSGTIGTRRIINLAPGALDTDAVNVGQLRQLESVQKEANMVYIDTKTGVKVGKATDGKYYPLDQYNVPNTAATVVELANIAIAVKDLSGDTVANVDAGNSQQAAKAGTRAFAYENVAKGIIEAENTTNSQKTRQGHQAINGAQFNQLGVTILGLTLDSYKTGFTTQTFTAINAASATAPTTYKGAIYDLITAVNKGVKVNNQKMELGGNLTIQGTTNEINVTTSTSGDPTITVALADQAKASLKKADTALQAFKYKAGSTEKTINQTTNTLEFVNGTNTTAEIDSSSKVKFNLNADLTGISSISQGNTKGTGVSISLNSDSLVLSGPQKGATLTLDANAITANSKKMTGLANGLINDSSTDSVTGQQLYSLFIDPAKITTDQTKAKEEDPSINEQAKANWKSWLGVSSLDFTYKSNGGKTTSTKKTVSLSDGLDFTNGTNTTAEIADSGVVKFNLNKDITLGASKTDTGSLTINTSAGALALTNAGKITGLQDGEISATSKEAVNGSQLKAVADLIANVSDNSGKPVYDVKKLTFSGDSNPAEEKDYYKRSLGDTVVITGHTLSTNDKIDDYVATNVATKTTSNGISILFAKKPTFDGIELGKISLTPQEITGEKAGLKLVLGKVGGTATDYVSLSGLANGLVKSDSTEAITGQQLYALFFDPAKITTDQTKAKGEDSSINEQAKANWKSWLGVSSLDFTYKSNGGKTTNTKKTVSLSDGLDFTNGTNTTAEIADSGVVKFNLNRDLTDISSIYQGSSKGSGAGFALTSDTLTMQAKAGGSTLKLDSNGVTVNSKITGVMAGTIGKDSSDAINGSQLWKVLGFDPDKLSTTGIGNTGKSTIAEAIAYLKEGFKIWSDDNKSNHSNGGNTSNNGGNTSNNSDSGNASNNGDNTANNEIKVPIGGEVGIKGDGRNTTTRVVDQNGKKAVEISLNDQVSFGNDGKDGKPATDGKVTIKGTNGITIEIDGKTGAINIVGQDSSGQSGTINIASQKASAKIGVTEATDNNTQLDGTKVSRLSYQSGNGGGTAFNPQPIQIATMNDGLKFTTDSGEMLKTLNQTVSIVGGQTGTDGAKNIETVAKDGQIQVKLQEKINLGSKGSITAGKIAINNDGRISGLADGKELNDAVTVRQLKQVNNETKQEIINLNKRVNKLATESRAGIAGAMAIAGLQTSAIAGRTVVSVGTATFKGENAVAIGISKISDNGKLGIRISGMSDSSGDRGGAISVGYGW
ncbi:YadA-like family protein [Gallibacterium salpingitidis]|uniref:YadA-like family protein n=1 Tax=Gallibacterium salpingitidis TaxID=505341 RepID=UPI0026701548|nr:YadA-like family protein [Gallibacterium salpingitidis]WKS99045.1 YadA-like family protein [Gallibacterium salpingitidis]